MEHGGHISSPRRRSLKLCFPHNSFLRSTHHETCKWSCFIKFIREECVHVFNETKQTSVRLCTSQIEFDRFEVEVLVLVDWRREFRESLQRTSFYKGNFATGTWRKYPRNRGAPRNPFILINYSLFSLLLQYIPVFFIYKCTTTTSSWLIQCKLNFSFSANSYKHKNITVHHTKDTKCNTIYILILYNVIQVAQNERRGFNSL